MNKRDNQKNQRIQVFARCRPLNSIEKSKNSPSVVEVIPEKKEIVLKDKNANREFYFDKVFPPKTDQIAVYKAVVGPLIQEVLMGYNCTVFAYGQTGTGKTYTMEGERNSSKCSWEDDPGAGIIPRSLHQLFEELNKEENVEFSVRVSFLELYNEELFDLLSSTDFSKLRLYEDTNRKGSVIIHGLEEILVNNKDEVYAILEKGTARRQTAATMLNATSSRSHTVFSVTVHIKENTLEGEELLKTGKLNLVDLAGSENVGRSGAIDKRAREAGNINQSLLTLGRVITALIEKQPHVPYRESKLTRLLQDSLGGHTKTSIIATISPAQCNFDETVSTLDYATKAKSITIRPEVNQKMTKRALLREYTEEIERLRKDLAAARVGEGFFIDSENYNSIVNKTTIQENTIKELSDKIETLVAEKAKVEEIFATTKEELDKTCQQLTETTHNLSETNKTLHQTREVLSKTALERDENQYIINIHKNTESQLTHQNETLIQVADQTTGDNCKLHDKIDRKQNVEKTNEELHKEFQTAIRNQDSEINNILNDNFKQQKQFLGNLKESDANLVSTINEGKKEKTLIDERQASSVHALVDDVFARLNENAENQKQQINFFFEVMNSVKDKVFTHIQTFKTEMVPSISSNYEAALTSMNDWYEKVQKDLTQEMQQQTDYLIAKIDEEQKNVSSLKNSLDSVLAKYEDQFLEYKKDIELSTKNREDLDAISNLLLSIRTRSDNSLERKNACEYQNNLNEFKTVIKPLGDMKIALGKIKEGVVQSKDIPNILNPNEFSREQDSVLQAQTKGSEHFTEILEDVLKLQNNEYKATTTTLESQISQICENKQQAEISINNNISALQSTREEDKKWLEKQTERLEDNVKHRRKLINQEERMCPIKESQLKQAILIRDQQLEQFNLVKDIPTGTTPQRKSYEYPRVLPATSPDDIIRERIRRQRSTHLAAAVNSTLNTSFHENDEPKRTSGNSSAASSHNVSFTSDVYESDGFETDSSVVSDISVNGKNKENLKKHKASKVPKKQFKKFLIPAPLQPRKPLSSSNPELV